MQNDVILNAEELQDLIMGVLEYNGKIPVSVEFLDTDGVPVNLASVRIVCEGSGLKVRVAPEEDSLEGKVRQYSTMGLGPNGIFNRKK